MAVNAELKIIKQFPEWRNKQFNVEKWNSQFVESNVIINTRSSNVYFPAHWTPLSIKCAFGGAEYYVTDNMKFRVDDRSFLIMNEGRMYESFIESEAPVESFTICFSPRFAADALRSLKYKCSDMLELSSNSAGSKPGEFTFSETLFRHELSLFQMFQSMRMSLSENKYNTAAYTEILHLILDKLVTINGRFKDGSRSVEKAKSSTRNELFKRLNTAKDYIDSCFSSQIELSEIAKTSGLSEHYMLREFKKLFGITPYQYLTNRRLEEAKGLLLKSANSISQISILVGFEYLSSFTKLFTRRFHVSPYKFRENNF